MGNTLTGDHYREEEVGLFNFHPAFLVQLVANTLNHFVIEFVYFGITHVNNLFRIDDVNRIWLGLTVNPPTGYGNISLLEDII
jgi:hypothetical protein